MLPNRMPNPIELFIYVLVILLVGVSRSTQASVEPITGEIRLFAGDILPENYWPCNGQLVSRTYNQALFSILGNRYGGDGVTTFALPNLNNRVPIGFKQGPGLTNYPIGATGGSETVTLTEQQLPQHSHTFSYGNANGSKNKLDSTSIPCTCPHIPAYSATVGNRVNMHAEMIGETGNSAPHNNMMPYVVSVHESFKGM